MAVFIWNAKRRAVLNTVAGDDLKIPETLWTYDAGNLEDFVNGAHSRQVEGRPFLEFYRSAILHQSDLAYSVALSLVTAFIWLEVAFMTSWPSLLACIPQTWLEYFNWFAWPAAAMAIIYGIADIAEDLKLAAILAHPQAIDRAEAVAANMLTRIKIMTLVASIVGALIAWLTQRIQWVFARRLKQVARA